MNSPLLRNAPLTRHEHLLIRLFSILGRQLRGSEELQILLHVYSIVSFPRRVYLRLCADSSRSAADREARFHRRHPNVPIQRRRLGDLLFIGLVGYRSRRLSHLPNVKRSNHQRRHQRVVFVEGRSSFNEPLLEGKYLLELLLHPLRTTSAVTD